MKVSSWDLKWGPADSWSEHTRGHHPCANPVASVGSDGCTFDKKNWNFLNPHLDVTEIPMSPEFPTLQSYIKFKNTKKNSANFATA